MKLCTSEETQIDNWCDETIDDNTLTFTTRKETCREFFPRSFYLHTCFFPLCSYSSLSSHKCVPLHFPWSQGEISVRLDLKTMAEVSYCSVSWRANENHVLLSSLKMNLRWLSFYLLTFNLLIQLKSYMPLNACKIRKLLEGRIFFRIKLYFF